MTSRRWAAGMRRRRGGGALTVPPVGGERLVTRLPRMRVDFASEGLLDGLDGEAPGGAPDRRCAAARRRRRRRSVALLDPSGAVEADAVGGRAGRDGLLGRALGGRRGVRAGGPRAPPRAA